ncbi:MAG TPA: hypothetical protein PK239_02780 [Chitinophagales bacterium]|nr:hypothetical protein [Chitinophagales bacterium]
MKNVVFQSEPEIFTIGAFLKPLKVTDSEGKEIWVWYVSEFEDSSFKDGVGVNPKENAVSLNELIAETETG